METDDLRAFLLVLDHGSFQAAAHAANLPRSTLRRRIDNLEAQLGTQLLVRHATGIVATPAGRVAAARGRQLVQEAHLLTSTLKKIEAEVRILVPPGLPPHMMVLALTMTRERLPHLRIQWDIHSDPAHTPNIDADLILHFGPIPATGAWTSTTLFRTPQRLLASESYLADHLAPQSPHQLADHPLLVWKAPTEDGTEIHLKNGSVLKVSPAFASTDIHLIRTMAQAGMGIAYLPDGGIPEVQSDMSPLTCLFPDQVGRDQALRALIPDAVSNLPTGERILNIMRELSAAVSVLE